MGQARVMGLLWACSFATVAGMFLLSAERKAQRAADGPSSIDGKLRAVDQASSASHKSFQKS